MYSASLMQQFTGKFVKFAALLLGLSLTLAIAGQQLTAHPWDWRAIAGVTGLYVIVFSLPLWLAACFMTRLYRLPSHWKAVMFIFRQMWGLLGRFEPWLVVGKARIIENALPEMGGPGVLVVWNDSAVVLQRAGRLTRVVGPGFCVLEPFEQLYDIIDLRPKHSEYQVKALTREGIPVVVPIEVHYQIQDTGATPTAAIPYPADEAAVFRAATRRWRREAGHHQDMTWEGWLIISQTEGLLRTIVGQQPVVALNEKREDLATLLQEQLKANAAQLGAKILRVKLNNPHIANPVTQQWFEVWHTDWVELTKTKQFRNRMMVSRQANVEQVQHELTGLSSLTNLIKQAQTTPLLAMRLLRAIKTSQTGQPPHFFVQGRALEAMQHLRELMAASSQPMARGPLREIPLHGRVSAGHGGPYQPNLQGYVRQLSETAFEVNNQRLELTPVRPGFSALARHGNYFVAQVAGNSLNQTGLCNGDYVLVAELNGTHLKPQDGDLVFVVFNQQPAQSMLKRLSLDHKNQTVTLLSTSSEAGHGPIALPYDAFAGTQPLVEVRGVIVAALK